MIRAICGALLAIVLAGCWESDYNAYFYYPHSTRSDYLGVVTGLDACRRAASARAHHLNMSSRDWSYVCCKKTYFHECAEKER